MLPERAVTAALALVMAVGPAAVQTGTAGPTGRDTSTGLRSWIVD
jgi:hypothetical protein